MSAAEMRLHFDQLQDVSGNPWFNDTEKDRFLMDAQMEIIEEEIKNLEEDKASTEKIKTLLKADTQSTDANGVLLDSVFDDASAAASPPLLLLSAALASGVPLKFVRHNDIGKFEDNTYKAGTATYPNYTTISTGYQTYPALNAVALDIVYIMEPTAITDLPEKIHYEQVARALEKTGYTTESQAMIMMGQEAKA